MNKQTLKALKGSIKKWQSIVNKTGVDRGTNNCPLCKLFYNYEYIVDHCLGCPVRNRTGEQYCTNTPYVKFSDLDDGSGIANTPEKLAAAVEELKFLKSLLPKEKKIKK
jgi:hypothetical protein